MASGNGKLPTVSVVMPVHNAEQYVAQAVESILEQTFKNFEFIILDDGSTDHSVEIIEPFAQRDERIRLILCAHRGLNITLNEGLALARGKYVARMDSDDISLPQRFAKQVEYLDAHPEVVVLGSRVMLMDPYGSPVAESRQKLTHEEIDHELLTQSGWAMVHPGVMMRKDALDQVKGYVEHWKHCEDHDLFLRMAEVGKLANLPEVLLWYRRHYASINFNKAGEQAAQKEALLRQAYARRGLQMPSDWKYQRWTPPPLPKQVQQWGWAAIKAGNLSIARRHALGAIWRSPLSVNSWRLMYCALRGR